jgi:hypothetical protein
MFLVSQSSAHIAVRATLSAGFDSKRNWQLLTAGLLHVVLLPDAAKKRVYPAQTEKVNLSLLPIARNMWGLLLHTLHFVKHIVKILTADLGLLAQLPSC